MISTRIAMPRNDDELTVAARAIAGVKDKHVPGAAARARRKIEAHIDAVLKIVIDAALDGDMAASRLLIERVVPVERSTPIKEPVPLTGEPADQAATVKQRLADGTLTLEEAAALLNSVEVEQRLRDAATLAERLAQLERQIAALGQPVRNAIDVESEPARSLPAPAKDEADAF
jgi:hypothetical protein